jgi:predicted nucleotide-binding protein (sugar kinase/HSP70/actin superfamily)
MTATPNAVKTAFTKESDLFSENRIVYLDPILNLQDRRICADQMYRAWAHILGLSREESDRALEAGFRAFADSENEIRRQARETLDQLERENRVGGSVNVSLRGKSRISAAQFLGLGQIRHRFW